MKLQFNIDAKFWRVMGLLGDLVKVNLLFLLTSLPLVTVGASLTAMYSVLFRLREEREGGVARDYFSAFRENFLPATVLWLVYAVFAAACALNVLVGAAGGGAALVMLGVVAALVSMVALYAFAMLARFRNSLAGTLRKAVLIGASGLPYTAVMFLVPAAALCLTFWTYQTILTMSGFWLLLGFALIGYLDVILFLRVFRRFTAPEDLPGRSDDHNFQEEAI